MIYTHVNLTYIQLLHGLLFFFLSNTDLIPSFDQLFNNTWATGESTEVMDNMLMTLEDYFSEFRQRCNSRSLVKLIGYCYNRFLVNYTSSLISACTKKLRSGARSIGVCFLFF